MYKSNLQEFCQKRGWNLPEYTAVRDGPDHNPRFTATVVVCGVPFETPKSECRSSKEAQNLAAKLAFDHFTEQLASNYSPSASRSANASGVRPSGFGTLHSQRENNALTSTINGVLFNCEDDKRPKDELHMYKNRLQHYAQKLSLCLPSYFSEFDGPPHARRFKSKVTLGDKTYETSEFFPTLKEAEHAAAKVAFESLSHSEIQEDETLYKSLLQQLAQREGLHLPKYSTTKSGPPHNPTFISAVEIGVDVFQGPEAKTRKQAEMRAAKVAFNALGERRARQISPPGYNMKGASEVTSSNLHPVLSIIDNGLPQDIANADPVNAKEADCSRESKLKEPLKISSSSVGSRECNLKEALEIASSSGGSVVPAGLQQNVWPKAEFVANQKLNEVQDAKRYRCSSSSVEVNGHLQDPFPPASSAAHDPALGSTQFKNQNESVKQKASGKIIVCPRNLDMAIIPGGASVLPFSDDNWVAVELNHQ